jgi:uncharacterized protein involved in type VI secretion and phage assembly
MDEDIRRFYGKYRGVVTDTEDPNELGRIKVKLEDFGGWKDNWCMPCVPYAGDRVGWFVIPEIGAHVWIEFEGGDPSRAIWTGCFWEAGKIPDTATPSRKVWKTPTCRVVLDDLDGKAGQLEIDATTRDGKTLVILMDKAGIKLTSDTGVVTMAMDDGITIEYPNAKVTLTKDKLTAKLGDTTTLTLTAQEQTLKATTIEIAATNELKETGTATASVTSGQYKIKAPMITLDGQNINLGL